MFISEVLFEIEERLKAHGMQNAKREAENLLCDLLHCSRQELHRVLSRLLGPKEEERAFVWLQRRLQGEPLAYISGHVEFYGCLFDINPHVLIPRMETEILVDKIANFLSGENLCDKILWDLCCGSGCIGIALKKKFPQLTVYLSDYSSEAITLAAHNAQANHCEVTCLHGDLLMPFRGKKAHFVVCNPPYISEEEYLFLDREVKDFEPRNALVAGESGLEIYERLADQLAAFLYPQARVWLEIGYRQGAAVQTLFKKLHWKNQRVENDWAGHNRFFFLENE